jgi:hypothetical protein
MSVGGMWQWGWWAEVMARGSLWWWGSRLWYEGEGCGGHEGMGYGEEELTMRGSGAMVNHTRSVKDGSHDSPSQLQV